MIKVLIADDHAVVRRGLRQIFSDEPDIVPAGEVSSGQEVLQAVQADAYDLVLLDMALPDASGLEILTQIRSLKPGLPVLFLSVYPEEQYAIRVLKAGAAGYLTKESAPDELVAAIRQVAQGSKYVTRSLAEKLAVLLEPEGDRPLHEKLSDREYQVMCLLAEGKQVSEIAVQLALSIKTVSTYRARVLEKLHLHNTAEIVRYAVQHDLAP
jgi:DNA-binding NarL/FixJ family response regulator